MFVAPIVIVAAVPGAASAPPSGSIDLVVSDPSSRSTTGVTVASAVAGSVLSPSTVAVLVMGTPPLAL